MLSDDAGSTLSTSNCKTAKRILAKRISISIKPRIYVRTPMRMAVERWMASHPYWLTHAFPPGRHAKKGPSGQALNDLRAYVRAELKDKNGVLTYPKETAYFKKLIGSTMVLVRVPFGIVRLVTGWV
jgi:hypothetical protein